MILVITGGIGSGKSTIAKALHEALPDYHVINYDDLVRKLYDDPRCHEHLMSLFGTINRKEVALMVFNKNNTPELDKKVVKFQQYVNDIIVDQIDMFLDEHDLVIFEYPMYFEDGGRAIVPKYNHRKHIIGITCPYNIRKDRVVARDSMSEEHFDAINQCQLPGHVRDGLVDDLIDTSSYEHTKLGFERVVDLARKESLRQRFHTQFIDSSVCPTEQHTSSLWNAVIDSYSQEVEWDNARSYHNYHHLYELFVNLDVILDNVVPCVASGKFESLDIQRLPIIILAIWFHDIVYEVFDANDRRKGYNEVASVQLMRQLLETHPNVLLDKDRKLSGKSLSYVVGAANIIMCTMNHSVDVPFIQNKPLLLEAAKLVLDLDMMILGASPERFKQYDNAIREEYATFSDSDYYAGRTDFFKSVLERDRIFFYADTLFADQEAQARHNITEWLKVGHD